MEKISLLLLIVKKTLIGSVIAGVLGFGSLPTFLSNNKTKSDSKIEKKAGEGLNRHEPTRR